QIVNRHDLPGLADVHIAIVDPAPIPHGAAGVDDDGLWRHRSLGPIGYRPIAIDGSSKSRVAILVQVFAHGRRVDVDVFVDERAGTALGSVLCTEPLYHRGVAIRDRAVARHEDQDVRAG